MHHDNRRVKLILAIKLDLLELVCLPEALFPSVLLRNKRLGRLHLLNINIYFVKLHLLILLFVFGVHHRLALHGVLYSWPLPAAERKRVSVVRFLLLDHLLRYQHNNWKSAVLVVLWRWQCFRIGPLLWLGAQVRRKLPRVRPELLSERAAVHIGLLSPVLKLQQFCLHVLLCVAYLLTGQLYLLRTFHVSRTGFRS